LRDKPSGPVNDGFVGEIVEYSKHRTENADEFVERQAIGVSERRRIRQETSHRGQSTMDFLMAINDRSVPSVRQDVGRNCGEHRTENADEFVERQAIGVSERRRIRQETSHRGQSTMDLFDGHQRQIGSIRPARRRSKLWRGTWVKGNLCRLTDATDDA
jgi:hypothetical protein